MKELVFAAAADKTAGQLKLNGEVFDLLKVPTVRIIHLVAAVNSADGMTTVGRVFAFFERALAPKDHKRFEDILLELDKIEDVMEVFQEALTIVSNDPTEEKPAPRRRAAAAKG